MYREDIRSRFRLENPEVTERVATDAQLNSWLIEGNINFATQARLITGTVSFSSMVGKADYDLTEYEPNFIDIDEFPGGGVAYNNKRIDLITKAELDESSSGWRTRSSGVPQNCFRRGKYLYLERPASSVVDIDVDAILMPDEFNNDGQEPFNELIYLRPYHYGLVLYLQGRAKMKVGKDEDKQYAMLEYDNYVKWCKKVVQSGTVGRIQFVPPDNLPTRVRGR